MCSAAVPLYKRSYKNRERNITNRMVKHDIEKRKEIKEVARSHQGAKNSRVFSVRPPADRRR